VGLVETPLLMGPHFERGRSEEAGPIRNDGSGSDTVWGWAADVSYRLIGTKDTIH